MTELDPISMPLTCSVNLAHALSQAVADDLGAQVLFLKGPIATRQGLRDRGHVSGDVDVLCRPDDHDAIFEALIARGGSCARCRLQPASSPLTQPR